MRILFGGVINSYKPGVPFVGLLGKQFTGSPRRDAAERYSVCTEKFHRKLRSKIKITPNTPKNESGLTQLRRMGNMG